MDFTTSPTDPHHPRPRWEDQHAWLADLAATDLAAGVDVRPTMVAFDTDGPLFLATLRPFEKGGHHDPIIEVGALAMAMGAVRLGISLAGRAWSTEDPIPPVAEGAGDLRQRVVVVHSVDGCQAPPRVRSTVWPVVADDALGGEAPEHVLGEPLEMDDGVVGWVVEALHVMVGAAEQQGDPTDGLAQLVRCESLGHAFAWGDGGLAWLESAAAGHDTAGEAAA